MGAYKKYVIDTSILIDYPEIIPWGNNSLKLEDSTIDLSEAHIIIPTAVIRELSSFSKEMASERGKVARMVLKRLRALFELEGFDVMATGAMLSSAYNMGADVFVGKMRFSILPVHKDFKKCLPFSPSEDDMDGQIILTAIAAEFCYQMLPIDGTAARDEVNKLVPTGSIILLTNDNGLAIRASRRGVVTSRYGYKPPVPYTGRRTITVPKDLFWYFYDNGKVEMDIWDIMMEDSDYGEIKPFVANEFIIMELENPGDYPPTMLEIGNPYFRHIGRYDAEAKAIVKLSYLSDFPEPIMNDGQAIYVEALMDPNFSAVICTGPAGSGKTYMATVYGCQACRNGDFIGVTVVPCASQSRIGALPGDLNEKMDPDVQPLKNALRNYLLKTDKALRAELKELQAHGAELPRPKTSEDTGGEDTRSINQKLHDKVNAIWNAWFSNLPIESARGRDFSYEVALYDEFQDQNATQADTLIKRLGTNGKIVITGDVEQIHAPYLDASNNGLVYASQLLYGNPMVAQVHFIEEEVVRHPLVKSIAEKQEAARKARENAL